MDILWQTEQAILVRDVLDQLAPERTLAYTTVMTVLDNLRRKGWVVRQRDGKAYRYQPAHSREESAAQAVRELLEASGDLEGVLLHFTRSASERELAALRKGLGQRRRRKP